MAHYSVRVTRDKPYEKLKEKELKAIQEEAVESIYSLIEKHVLSFNLSKKEDKNTVLEFDIDVNTPRITRDKENKPQFEF